MVAIIGIIAAIAVPGLLRARMSGNEASAIGSIRTIASAEATYASACGGGGYAVTVADLGEPPTAGGPAFIPADLKDAIDATNLKSGYFFTIANGPAGTHGARQRPTPATNAAGGLEHAVLRGDRAGHAGHHGHALLRDRPQRHDSSGHGGAADIDDGIPLQ